MSGGATFYSPCTEYPNTTLVEFYTMYDGDDLDETFSGIVGECVQILEVNEGNIQGDPYIEGTLSAVKGDDRPLFLMTDATYSGFFTANTKGLLFLDDVNWSSSNSEIASVSSDGNVTARKCGSVTITAQAENGASASAEFTVEHVLQKVPAVEATCTEAGNIEYWSCENCGKFFRDSEGTQEISQEETVVAAKGHSWSSWTVTEEPTCTRDGKRERICANCGCKETETISAPGHKWDEEYTVGKEATCTEEGYEAIFCSVCHIFDESTVREIPKKEHTCEEWTVTKEATCTEDGSREGVCEYCGAEITETIPATGHIWNDYYTRDVEPTETEEGSESIHCSVCDAINESTVKPVPVLKGTWKQDRNGWWYDRGDGTYPRDGFEVIKGVTYYFDASGYMRTGWVKDDGDWYYFAASGAMVKDNWQQSGSVWYYFDEDGKMLTGLQEINGTSYFFKDSGAMATGWQQIDGDWYFFAGSGAMVKGNWQQSGSTWYYFGEDGKMLTGLQEVNGTTYFFKDSGAMATGWQQIDGDWYFFNAGGAMVKENWLSSGGKWYYFDEDGKMVTDFKEIGANEYYFNASGAMLTGWQQIEGAWYYFEASGAMVRSRWIGSYYVGPDGKWIPGDK